jgi:phospholipid/cholesterol/gamma-HCH transport system substrate-binding protein
MRRLLAPAALVLGITLVAIIILSSGAGHFSVTASFDDVQGLVDGAQVRLAGVAVGSVQKIWLGADGWPRVRMSIDDDVSLHTDASVAVRMASLSGEFNRYVSLVQGSGPPLPAGAAIARARTESPIEVDDALQTFSPSTRAALTRILAGSAAATRGQGAALAATLHESEAALTEIAALAGDVGDDGTALSVALHSSHTIASTLASRSSALGTAVDQSSRLLATLAARAGSLTGTLTALPSGLDAAQNALDRAHALIAPADRLLATAAPAVAQLPPAASELDNALRASTPTLAKAQQVVDIAPAAARAMLPVLQAARPLLAVMIPVLHRIGPMLDQLRVRLPDAFSFFANWADFTSNYDANGHAARVGIVLPPAPTNVLSPSSNGPGQLEPPYLRTPGSLEGQPWTDYFKSFVDGGAPGPDVK